MTIKPQIVKILQMQAVMESTDTGSEDHGTWQRIPREDATLYGLGDDGNVYRWSYGRGQWLLYSKEA